MQSAQGLSSLAMGISSAVTAGESLVKMFKEGDFSLSSLLSVMTSMGMALPMLMNGWTTLTGAMKSSNLMTALLTKTS